MFFLKCRVLEEKLGRLAWILLKTCSTVQDHVFNKQGQVTKLYYAKLNFSIGARTRLQQARPSSSERSAAAAGLV